MTMTYDRVGVRFQYPENWKITDEESRFWPREVTLESPTGAIWSVHVYDSPVELEEIAAEALRALRQEYNELEVEAVTDQLATQSAVGYDIHFYYLDLLVTAQIRGFMVGQRSVLLLCQAESRDFDALELVFRAMVESMFRSGHES